MWLTALNSINSIGSQRCNTCLTEYTDSTRAVRAHGGRDSFSVAVGCKRLRRAALLGVPLRAVRGCQVFRTYNASYTLDKLLFREAANKCANAAELKLFYDRANRDVAILCNHQKGVSKNHDASMEKKQNEIKLLQAEREQYKVWSTSLEPPPLSSGSAAVHFSERPNPLNRVSTL